MEHLAPKAADSFLTLRPPAAAARRFRAAGIWRDSHYLADLDHWRSTTPDAPAVYAHTAATGTTTRLTYAEYGRYVNRCAGALRALGVGPGQVVAVQLPNWWQAGALLLACLRVGAAIAPMTPTLRPRELERVLRRLRATMCVVPDRWDGFAHAAALAEIAPRLPDLHHRVVLGRHVAEGDIDFFRHVEGAPWERTHPAQDDPMDPDRVALVLFTSGTTGEPKAALHTLNIHYSTCRPYVVSEGYGPRDAYFTPHSLTHSAGLWGGIGLPVLTGGAAVLMDVWEPRAALDLMAESRCSLLAAAPTFLSGLVAEARRRAVPLPALRAVMAPGVAVGSELLDGVAEMFGLPVRAIWGMTEASGTYTRADDPPDWALHSAGRPAPGIELDHRSDAEVSDERPGRLHVRGGSVCLATVGRDTGEVRIVADHDDGWFDTGDLTVPDGRGGIRIVGRAADRVGSKFMIPVLDVERALLEHAGIKDAAVVGYLDAAGTELACAVTVQEGEPLDLPAVHAHLRSIGMTEWYWPSRLETVHRLPRNSFGKVRKELLRRWLAGAAELPDDPVSDVGEPAASSTPRPPGDDRL